MPIVRTQRKIIQIAGIGGVTADTEGGFNYQSELYALCDDGTVWMIESAREGWFQVKEIPENAASEESPHVR